MAWEMVDTSTADRTMWGLCVRSVNLSTAGSLAAGCLSHPPSPRSVLWNNFLLPWRAHSTFILAIRIVWQLCERGFSKEEGVCTACLTGTFGRVTTFGIVVFTVVPVVLGALLVALLLKVSVESLRPRCGCM